MGDELATQSADMRIDQIGRGRETGTPHLLQQHGPGDRAIGVAGERQQHPELDMLQNAIRRVFKGVTFNFQNHFQEMNYLHPIPPYSYSYKATNVKCKHCTKKFPHTELIDGEE